MVKLCNGCMKEKHGGPVCEHCGYDERELFPDYFSPPGTILQGRYILGRGNPFRENGIKYIGLDVMQQETVSVREYRISYDPEQDFEAFRDRLLSKTKQLSAFADTPGILVPNNRFEENGRVYLVEKYVAGDTLDKIVERGPIDPSRLLRLLRPLMEALEKIHEAGQLHLNIIPESILVDPQGNAVLTDFYCLNENAVDEFGGAIPGKFAYWPIERFSAKGRTGPWTDVYSLGAVIYYCLTAQRPVFCPSRLMEGLDLDWYSVHNLSYQQREALRRCTELSPENRTQSMSQLMEDLYGCTFVNMDPHTPDDHFLAGVPATTDISHKNWFGKLFGK